MHKLAIAVCLASSLSLFARNATAQTDAIPLFVEGRGFSVATLRGGGGACANRNYVWDNVPAQFEGWKFTKISGGKPAEITANGPSAGYIYIAADSSMKEAANGIAGWETVPNVSFTLTDKKRTTYAVYRKQQEAGAPLLIPRFPWGGLVLAPTLTRVGDAEEPATVVVGTAAGRTTIVVPGGIDDVVVHPHVIHAHAVRRARIVRHTTVVHHPRVVRHEHVTHKPIKALRKS